MMRAILSLPLVAASFCLTAGGPDSMALHVRQVEAQSAVAVQVEVVDPDAKLVVSEIQIQAPVARRWGAAPPVGFALDSAPPDPLLQPLGAELTVLRWTGAIDIDPQAGARIEIPVTQRTGERTRLQINYELLQDSERVGQGAMRFSVVNADLPPVDG